MPRVSPIHYIAPSSISVTPNANQSANDLAVYVARGAKIKVYSPRAGINMVDSTYQEWTLTGRNRRLAESEKPYTIYARLQKNDKSKGYLVFAPKNGNAQDGWTDKYNYVTTEGWTKIAGASPAGNNYYIRLGEVSLPENNERTVYLDTGILDTDDFNNNWAASPDALPLRVELGCTINDEDAGPTPYVYWGQSLVLTASLVEGWTGTDIERFDHWEITRDTQDTDADNPWNHPTGAGSYRGMTNGSITLSHARGANDDFNGSVSAVFTVTAMERIEDENNPGNPTYEPLVSETINIHAETLEKYELVLSSRIVSFNPTSETYNPAGGVAVRVRATDQSGYVFDLTTNQITNSGIAAQYAIDGSSTWTTLTFVSDPGTGAGVATISTTPSTTPFAAQKNVNMRILSAGGEVLFSDSISYLRDGEDSKEREWIFLRSINPITFVDAPGPYQKPALISLGEVNPPNRAANSDDDNKNQDGWVPNGWWDEQQGADEDHPYEYGAYRDFVRSASGNAGEGESTGGQWGSFTDPKIWSHYGGDAVTYDIVPSVSIINADAAGHVSSDGIIIQAFRIKGSERSGNILPPTTGSAYYVEYSIDGGTWTQCAMFSYQPEGEVAVQRYGIAPLSVKQAQTDIALRLKNSANPNEILKENPPIKVVNIVSEEETQAIVEEVGDARYIRRDINDEAQGKITFRKGADFADNAQGQFTPDAVGAGIWQDENKNWHIEGDFLHARKKLTAKEVQIEDVSHIGGQQLLTAAGMHADFVVEKENVYRCFFLKVDSNGREVRNRWAVGDQAYVCTFNLKVTNTQTSGEGDKVGNHYLWRLVSGVSGTNNVDTNIYVIDGETYDASEYHFIDLSKTDCDSESDAPWMGDDIVQLGNRNDTDRQNAIILAGAGSASPYIRQFVGIDSFTLPSPDTQIKPNDNLFTGRVTMMEGSKIGDTVIDSLPDDVLAANELATENAKKLDNLSTGNNLLKNTGFRGQYTSREMNANLALDAATELWSPSLDGWQFTNAVAIDDQGNVSASGKLCQLSSGSIRQTLMFPVASEKDMVFSFKGKGTSVTLSIGGYTETISLSNAYDTKTIRFKTSSTADRFELTGTAHICELYLSEGSVAPSTWEPSPYDNPQAFAEMLTLEYLKSAIHQGSTTVLGGLILSNLIELGNYVNKQMREVTAGISGIYNNDEDVAFWGGGTMAQAIKTVKLFKNNPSYKPTEEEWQNLAHAIITHGGDVIMKGTIFAENGFFRGKIEAKEGYMENVSLTGSLNLGSQWNYRMFPRSNNSLSTLTYVTDIGNEEHRVLEYGLQHIEGQYEPYLTIGDWDDSSTDRSQLTLHNEYIVAVNGTGSAVGQVHSDGFNFDRSVVGTMGTTASCRLVFEEQKDENNKVVGYEPHLYAKNSDESGERRIF